MDLTGTGFIEVTNDGHDFKVYVAVKDIKTFSHFHGTTIFLNDGTKVLVKENAAQMIGRIRLALDLPMLGDKPKLEYSRDSMIQFGILMKKGVFSFDDTIAISEVGKELDNFDNKWLGGERG